MERRAILLCGTVAFLGLLSAALGFAAEAKRIKVTVKKRGGFFIYDILDN